MGFPRPGPDVAEVSVRADGSRRGEGGSEAQVEVAANAAEQGGQWRRKGLEAPGEPGSAARSRTRE